MPSLSTINRKRPSDTPIISSPPTNSATSTSSTSANSNSQTKPPSRIKVTFKKWHAVSKWSWGTSSDDSCGICQSPFEGCAPGVKFPGDECPVVWGKCKHAFHLQCVSMWLGSGKGTCPICRREWEFDERDDKEGEVAVKEAEEGDDLEEDEVEDAVE